MRQRARFTVALAATLIIGARAATTTTTPTAAATTSRPAAARRWRPALRSRRRGARPTGPPARSRYLSGFDFAATASIIDVVVAEDRGYFEDLCLDVELQPSFSTANYPIVAAGDAQFASGGSFSEVVNFAAANEADLVAVAVEGRSAIDSLILKPGVAERLEDLEGTTIGVKGQDPPERRGDARLGGPGRGRGLHHRARRRVRPAGPHRAAGDRRVPRVQEQRAGSARAGRRRLRPLRPVGLRDPRFLRRALHHPRVHRRASDRGAGLPAGGDARAGRRAGRSRGGRGVGDRARRGRRQSQLPLARGRDLPLDDRRRADHRRDAGGDRGRSARSGAAAGGGRRLRGGRPVRRGRRAGDRRPLRGRTDRRGVRRHRHGHLAEPA